MRTPESFEKQDIRNYLRQRNIWHFMPQGTGFGTNGIPDIIGCYKGRFFGIEVKRPGKKPTPMQFARLAEIEKSGGGGFWGDAEKVLNEFSVWIATIDS